MERYYKITDEKIIGIEKEKNHIVVEKEIIDYAIKSIKEEIDYHKLHINPEIDQWVDEDYNHRNAQIRLENKLARFLLYKEVYLEDK